MDTDFIFNYVMDHEDARRTGVITHDAGGATRFGICQKWHPEEFPALLNMPTASALARAFTIFLIDYVPVEVRDLHSVRVAAKIVDIDFNLGAALKEPHGMGIRIAQQGCCKLGQPVIMDGTLGARTIAAINACDPDALLNEMCAFELAVIQREYFSKKKAVPLGLIRRAHDRPK